MKASILRALFAVAACALLGGQAFAQSAPAPDRHSIVNVAGDVYRFQNNDHYGVFLVTRTGIIVADPISRSASQWLKGELDTRYPGKPVKYVLYSHHDWDHASGGGVFANTATYVGQETFKKAIDDGAPKDNGRQAYLDRFNDVRAPDVTFAEKKTVTLDGQSVELLHQKSSHATDLSYIWFPKEKVLFVVDVINIKRLPYQAMGGFSEADTYGLIDAATALKPAFIVPGHGAVGTLADLAAYKQYHVDLLNGVKAGAAAGKTLPEIQASLTLDQYKDWGSYAQFRPLNIQGAYAYVTKK